MMSSKNSTVTPVIVNWNSGSQLRECVDSIAKFGGGFIARTVVVDNGSADGSEASVEGVQDVTLIRAGSNLGFGKACNLGAREANSDYLLFLNPDALLYADTLHKSLQYMQDPEHAKVGICGVQLQDEDGHVARSCARFPSAGGFALHALGVDRFLPKLGHAMADWDHAQTRKVDHVIGAFFLVRREMFVALNGFDEQFFVYLEDLDFSYRAHQAGWSSVYLADVRAFHAGGGTSRQIKARRLFYSLRSRVEYAFKHFSRAGALLVLFVTLLAEPVARTANAALRGSWSGVKETLAAFGMLFGWLPGWALKGAKR